MSEAQSTNLHQVYVFEVRVDPSNPEHAEGHSLDPGYYDSTFAVEPPVTSQVAATTVGQVKSELKEEEQPYTTRVVGDAVVALPGRDGKVPVTLVEWTDRVPGYPPYYSGGSPDRPGAGEKAARLRDEWVQTNTEDRAERAAFVAAALQQAIRIAANKA